MTSNSPNDSAISVVIANSSPAFKPPTPILYQDLTPEQRAALEDEAQAATLEAQHGIQVDNTLDFLSDDGYETDSVRSASTSISSSARDFVYENGRTYHRYREGAYNFPNDGGEQEREVLKHNMLKVLFSEKLFFAPIEDKNGMEVLDMGTGTGKWAIELGDQYPSANILGVDLSPIQDVWTPANVRFMIDDLESPWLTPMNHYDFIHARHTVMAIKDWPGLMKQCLDHLKPGGWLELQEIHHLPRSDDNTIPPTHPVAVFWSLIIQGLAVLGVNFNATELLEGMMKEAGFVNVTTRIFRIPIGTWAENNTLKEVGYYWRDNLMMGCESIALGPLTRGLGWSMQEVIVWLVEVRKGYMDESVHAYMPYYIITGQKPES